MLLPLLFASYSHSEKFSTFPLRNTCSRINSPNCRILRNKLCRLDAWWGIVGLEAWIYFCFISIKNELAHGVLSDTYLSSCFTLGKNLQRCVRLLSKKPLFFLRHFRCQPIHFTTSYNAWYVNTLASIILLSQSPVRVTVLRASGKNCLK